MEELGTFFRDLEETYNDYISAVSRAACYAEEHPEIEYSGLIETFDLELEDYRADQLLERELVEAQNMSMRVQDEIQRLSKEIQIYRERKDEKPEEFFLLGEKFSELKQQFTDLDSELTDIMRQFDRTEEPEIEKQRSIIGSREAENLAGQITYEPR
ncbi:MAG: hypothetical protein ABEK10_04325 [Candidatus Nanosalina sp.]